MSNFYEQNEDNALEKLVLAEDISFSEVKNITGKFFMPVMTPEAEMKNANQINHGKYSTQNYIELKIPAYMLLSFMNPTVAADKTIKFPSTSFIIPKGTVFLAGFLGGIIRLDKLAIVGIFLQ